MVAAPYLFRLCVIHNGLEENCIVGRGENLF